MTGTCNVSWEIEFLVTTYISEDRTLLVCLICRQKLTQINKGHVRKHMMRAHKDSVDSMTLDAKKSLKEK